MDSGNLAQDNANFFFNNTTNRLGLGTTTPNQILTAYGTNPQSAFIESGTEFLRTGVGETAETSVIGWDDSDSLRLGVYDSPYDTSISSLMTILSTGEVGIGTSTPNEILTVYHASDSTIQLGRAGTPASTAEWNYNSGTMNFGTNDADDVAFMTDSTTRLTIQNTTGYIGIGDITPSALLNVGSGNVSTADGVNDLFVTGDIETDGHIYAAGDAYVDGGDFYLGAAGVSLATADGSIYFAGLGNGFDESLRMNLDDTSNEVTFTSGTGVVTAYFSGINLKSPVWLSAAADPADAGAIRLGNAEVIGWEASPAGTDVTLTVDSSENFVFSGANTIGIGTTTPSRLFSVAGDSASGYMAAFFNDGNNANRYGIQVTAGADDGTGTTYYLNAYDGNGDNVGYIANTSGTFAVTDVSDIRTKTNITDTDIRDALTVIEDLRVVDFNRIADPDGPRITGFIAQDVQEVYPYAVTVGPNGYLGLMKDAFVPLLVKSIQELNINLDTLVASTSPSSTPASRLFAKSFFERMAEWMGETTNGIKLFVADKIETKELCVADDSGDKTCITKSQLDDLISNQGTAAAGGSSNPPPAPELPPEPTPEPNPIPDVELTPDPVPEPTPEPESTPEPEPTTEPQPAE
jgi:hypothetical protein